ncbi:hypothetical protein H2O64_11255 [Kordia sp. YSTF-M3]|uniref:Uncharacterized protein n=1 Tax=Kordia aestuariivivens TaxID=2759037 RepID=A0ABR7QA97_9FLAO|nr:hypothetical protein [Kordia aestuariivivens]MBC8755254.1 hypothetical protein [Kordia aestuariivivens]
MHLIWALINTAFVILFFGLVLTLFTKGKQLFNNKYGNAIIVVFVLGVIGMLGAEERDFDNHYSFHNAKNLKGNNVTSLDAHVEETIPFILHLTVLFKKNDKGELVASDSHSDMSGFTNGHDWEVTYVDVDKQEDGTYTYQMSGAMHWYLFGIKIYTQSKTFKGTLE